MTLLCLSDSQETLDNHIFIKLLDTRRGKSISPDLSDINPRRRRRPSGFRVDIVHPVDDGELAAGGYGFFAPASWLFSFVPVRLAVPPGGPNPPDGSACYSGIGAPGARAVPGSGFRSGSREKTAEENPPPYILSAFNPVIDVSVLDHRVSSVTSYDDMIENQNSDSVQQALELNC